MKNKSTKNKSKKRGSENAFGCDLIEHLQNSGQDVPQVLIKCAEFIEEHGIVDGIYRLSGVTSNIQRLRQEFSSEVCPDLTKEVYPQDIHCVGSLCKLYFRELPNPLLTYELYSKFTEVVKVQGDHERLLYIQRVVRDLPTPHLRTLEYLTKHLAHLATLSARTNMHTRNLALVWAPNLLRSKDIEESSGNGDMAFQAVRIQQSVVEFILNHTEQIFSRDSVQVKPREGLSLLCGEKYATLPISGQCGPMKLMSLEEAQARSLGPNHPVHRERQRENSLPDTSTAALYHTVIDIDSKRKLSGKSKKWRSIFNLGRSVEPKGKLSRNGSVFIRAPGLTEKAAFRPSRSMESLCSLPTEEDRTGSSPAGGIYVPDVKSRTLGSDLLYDLSDHDQNCGLKGNKAGEATGGWSSGLSQKASVGASAPPLKTLPEQLKVYKSDELSGFKPTSPKNRRMLYSGSSNSSSRPSFPGSFFPLESSPRHQRRAVNISEPFAVSVPLRVSAVISSNSTPCRGLAKDKAVTLKPCKESSEQSSGRSNTPPQVEPKKEEGTEEKTTEELTSRVLPEDASKEMVRKDQGEMNTSELKSSSHSNATENEEAAQSPGKEPHSQTITPETDKRSSSVKELWSDLQQELKIVEPELDFLDETFKPVFGSKSTCEVTNLTMAVKSKRSRSSPSLSLLFREQSSNVSLNDHGFPAGSASAKKQPSESDLSFHQHKNMKHFPSADMKDEKGEMLHQKLTSLNKDDPAPNEQCQLPPEETETCSDKEATTLTIEDPPIFETSSLPDEIDRKPETHAIPLGEANTSYDGAKEQVVPESEVIPRLSVCLEEKRNTLMLPLLDNDGGCGCSSEDLDLVEPWEDLGFAKQWVTSPLHSPDVEELFNRLAPFGSCGETLSSEGSKMSPPSAENNKQPLTKSTEPTAGNVCRASSSQPNINWTNAPSTPTRVTVNSNNGAQPLSGKSSTTKQKTSASSQGIRRHMSYDGSASGRWEENDFSKHRPYSLNLDTGHRCIRDISNQQDRNSSEFSSCQRGSLTTSGNPNNGFPSELDLFLSDRQAPLRRNSAPVSVSSVRTAFMIKTCQAKAVPVIPPRVQYSQIPHSRHENDFDAARDQEKAHPKMSAEKPNPAPPVIMSNLKEELENREPAPKPSNTEKYMENVRTPELPATTRRHTPSLEVFVDCPRPNRGNLLQKSSFRNRQRPQSLILFSPPFPIMDYPHPGDDSKLLSSIKSLNDASAGNAFPKEMAESIRAPEAITLQNKMTIPKSGQRLETSTSCFYQPQRRSMIFDSRSHRQIE
ncbi:rho GTPase-activating protein 31 [Brachionichthys hirsutus]|uniref:rho GTPase-activating protein 31 n=1 Tax=Brachionichthys hirsutus TaxID=412623 RepID=UPI003604C46E